MGKGGQNNPSDNRICTKIGKRGENWEKEDKYWEKWASQAEKAKLGTISKGT